MSDIIELSDDEGAVSESFAMMPPPPLEKVVLLTTPVAAPALWSVGGPASRLLVPIREATSKAEFDFVAKRWVDGGMKRTAIHTVYRIQNGALYSTYVTYRSGLAAAARKREPPMMAVKAEAGGSRAATAAAEEAEAELANEDTLWHGADDGTIRSIIKHGFDMRVSNQMGALGAGNYFAWKASYSVTYAVMAKHSLGGSSSELPELHVPHGARMMLLARVALGRPGPGNRGYRVPVEGSDSATCKANAICCVFDNAACYPEYVVVFWQAGAGRQG